MHTSNNGPGHLISGSDEQFGFFNIGSPPRWPNRGNQGPACDKLVTLAPLQPTSLLPPATAIIRLSLSHFCLLLPSSFLNGQESEGLMAFKLRSPAANLCRDAYLSVQLGDSCSSFPRTWWTFCQRPLPNDLPKSEQKQLFGWLRIKDCI